VERGRRECGKGGFRLIPLRFQAGRSGPVLAGCEVERPITKHEQEVVWSECMVFFSFFFFFFPPFSFLIRGPPGNGFTPVLPLFSFPPVNHELFFFPYGAVSENFAQPAVLHGVGGVGRRAFLGKLARRNGFSVRGRGRLCRRVGKRTSLLSDCVPGWISEVGECRRQSTSRIAAKVAAGAHRASRRSSPLPRSYWRGASSHFRRAATAVVMPISRSA